MMTTTTMTGRTSYRGRLAEHQIGLFVLLAFAISWSVWPMVRANPESTPLVPFGPGLAAILVATVVGGRRDVVSLLRGLLRFRVPAVWYAAALGVPLAIAATARGVVVAGGAPAPLLDIAGLVQLLATIAITIVVVGLFEELGWRGFLLPRLQQRRRALDAALVVGAVWLPWHLPELLTDSSERPLLQFALIIMAESVVLTWLYNSTGGSLPVVMLFHAAYNSAAQFFLADLPADAVPTSWWVMSLATAAAAAVVVGYAGGRTLRRGHA